MNINQQIDNWIWKGLDEHYESLHTDPDCEDGDCGECPSCMKNEYDAYMEAKGEAEFERMREEKYA